MASRSQRIMPHRWRVDEVGMAGDGWCRQFSVRAAAMHWERLEPGRCLERNVGSEKKRQVEIKSE